jgi:hypothetical protein
MYLLSAYPFAAGAFKSSRTSSLTGLSLVQPMPMAAAMDDRKRSVGLCSAFAANMHKFVTPLRCLENALSGKLKLTGHALWIISVTVLLMDAKSEPASPTVGLPMSTSKNVTRSAGNEVGSAESLSALWIRCLVSDEGDRLRQ